MRWNQFWGNHLSEAKVYAASFWLVRTVRTKGDYAEYIKYKMDYLNFEHFLIFRSHKKNNFLIKEKAFLKVAVYLGYFGTSFRYN